MKKILTIVLALALVMSFGISAFAETATSAVSSSGTTATISGTAVTSPTKEEASEETSSAVPATEEAAPAAAAEEEALEEAVPEVEEAEDNEIEASDIIMLPLTDADELNEEDKAAFLEAFEEAKKITDKLVKYLFWFDVPEEKGEISPEHPYNFRFRCEGEDVGVQVNGNEMAVENIQDDLYQATLTETGAVMITTALEEA